MNLYFRFPDFKTKALTLSYDDGTVHDRRMVGILNRYGIKCTFNLNSGILGAGGRISREEAAELYRGHEIAVHTLTHPRLDCVSTAEAAREILLDRQNLEEITGGIVDGMAYPYGLYDTNGEPETAALCGIRYARTTLSTHGFGLPKDFLRWNPTCHHADSSFAELAGRFLAPDDTEHFWRISPKLFYIWGHSYEFENNNNWELLEEICEKLGGRGAVWYATNKEVCGYISDFKRLESSSNGEGLFNPTAQRLYASAGQKELIIEPGQTVRL